MRTKLMFALVLVPCAFAQKAPDSKTPDQRFADLVVSAAPMGLAKTSNGLSTTREDHASIDLVAGGYDGPRHRTTWNRSPRLITG